jgi:hypothetical protein
MMLQMQLLGEGGENLIAKDQEGRSLRKGDGRVTYTFL